MKKCKYCQTEIDSKAKICPNCQKKQGLPGFVKVLIALAIVFFLIISMLRACVNNVNDAIGEVNDSIEEINDSFKETENSYLDVNGKTTFNVNETFENAYLKITMSEVSTDFKNYSQYLGPKDGYKVVMAKFDVENIGAEDQYISNYEFNCYADNVAMESFYYANDNYQWLSATISSKRQTSGYVFYEVPKNANSIVLEYDASWLDNNNIEFIIK